MCAECLSVEGDDGGGEDGGDGGEEGFFHLFDIYYPTNIFKGI